MTLQKIIVNDIHVLIYYSFCYVIVVELKNFIHFMFITGHIYYYTQHLGSCIAMILLLKKFLEKIKYLQLDPTVIFFIKIVKNKF